MKTTIPSGTFAEALRSADRSRLIAFPKADRHCHSIFGTSLQSIADWAGRPIKPAPSRMANLEEMRDYAHRELYPHIRNRRGFEFTAENSIIEAIQDGVSVLEMSLDADFARLYDRGVVAFIDFVSALVRKHCKEIDFHPEIGLSKNREPSLQIKLALQCIESGIFKSIDLYGNEHAQQPEAYVELFRNGKRRGLKLKAHVGEFGDAAFVERTLRVLDLDEIQHGVTVASSSTLMSVIRNKRIRLNVSPSSNVALSAVKDLRHHPIRALFQNGVRVSINSDDKTIFGKSTTGEYIALSQAGTLDPEELDAIRMESLTD